MRGERFGSYSIASTTPVTPSLSRRKSMKRYRFRLPPPMWRTARRPTLLRPPVLRIASVSRFSGRFFVMSRVSVVVAPRRPGVIGLYSRTGISDDVQPEAFLERHVRLLHVLALAVEHHVLLALDLALQRHRADGVDLDVEGLLDRVLDVGLGRLGSDDERVDVPLLARHGLLGEHGPPEDLVGALHFFFSPPAFF